MNDRKVVRDSPRWLSDWPPVSFIFRCVVGGTLMGLANLVPGISGGTMLLAAGVYPEFVGAVAGLSMLRVRVNSVVVLAAIGGSAGVAILLLAGTMRLLVIEQRWVMYSLFIGLTLGGVPLVWKLLRPATFTAWIGATVAFGLMVLMALGTGGAYAQESNTTLLLLSGLAGASAMILPGVSGGYLLLLLGQYEPILGAVDQLKEGLLVDGEGGPDFGLVWASMGTVIPVGVGVVVGIVGVSNLLKWLLDRYKKLTLGALLGLLVGALVGLYPFQAPPPPESGVSNQSRVLKTTDPSEGDTTASPLQPFSPSPGQIVGSTGLVVLGLGITVVVARLGRRTDSDG